MAGHAPFIHSDRQLPAGPTESQGSRARIRAAYREDETRRIEALLPEARLSAVEAERTDDLARRLVSTIRRAGAPSGLDAFLHEYELSNAEGVMLMCLAEALLRIPDADTADRLIRDKVAHADWERHLGHSASLFVNASTWGLMLTGRVINLERAEAEDIGQLIGRLVARSGEPVIRQAMIQAMRIMGRQFVLGRTIDEALERAADAKAAGYRHSFDMLGEGARTMADAERYWQAYAAAIRAIGATAEGDDLMQRPSISVKLSALHPRFREPQRERILVELVPKVLELALAAKAQGIALTIDSEEAERLELWLDVFSAVYGDAALDGWPGLGLAVQAYQKRAPFVIDWLADLARLGGRRIPVRLVKGAYWDSEIKRAQELGLDGYPVFTRKAATDVSYLACARRILAGEGALFPQFATHNAHTLAAVAAIAGARPFEFQRLHGMGEQLYDQIVGPKGMGLPCRIYAPVGSHEDLLAYLVRRLLENGANSSFVNRIVDADLAIDEVIADPVEALSRLACKPHPRIPLPAELYLGERRNALGLDLSDRRSLDWLAREMAAAGAGTWRAGAAAPGGRSREVRDPADNRRFVGQVSDADAKEIASAVGAAKAAAAGWDATPAAQRAACLERVADAYEAHLPELMAYCVREAGKTVEDSLADVREAVDFCRYYAARARSDFVAPLVLDGPTGESNEVRLHGRGAFVCISPWNFPIAIFTGQVAAALAAGNAVLAKPAEQTSLIAARAVELMHGAGVPEEVLHLLPGDGAVGAALVADPRIDGVAFTGSTDTARRINATLAARDGSIVPLIAETGGQNAMVVDSSALPEQVIDDVLRSAFASAGQRCSALRVLFLQRDIARRVATMLTGAMEELRIGDPGLLATDVGPVIDARAQAQLRAHMARMRREAEVLRELALPPESEHGTFVPPAAYRIEDLGVLEREVFGPILHVVEYEARDLEKVCDAINGTGYGLTLGIHSRIEETVERITARVRAGNIYVNRNMIGAVVGVQPFGGEGLSGTGPKAGGPRYLYRFATERAVSVNTAAAGGNAALMALEDF